MKSTQATSVIRPRRPRPERLPPKSNVDKQIHRQNEISNILGNVLNKAFLVFEEFLQDTNPCEQRFSMGSFAEVEGLNLKIKNCRNEQENYAIGANSLRRAAQEESSPKRQLLLLEARTELSCRAYLAMAESFHLGRQKLILRERPIDAEIVRREWSDRNEEFQQEIVKLFVKSPLIISSIMSSAGVEIEAKYVLLVCRVLFCNFLQYLALVLVLLGHSIAILGVAVLWPSAKDILSLFGMFLVVFIFAASFMALTLRWQKQPMAEHDNVQAWHHETHECAICSHDLLDFAPDHSDGNKSPQQENNCVPNEPFEVLATLNRIFESGRRPWPKPVQCRECRQLLHAECLSGWMKQHQNCPFCRAEISREFQETVIEPLAEKHRVQKREFRHRS